MNYTIQLFDVMSQLHSVQDLVIAAVYLHPNGNSLSRFFFMV